MIDLGNKVDGVVKELRWTVERLIEDNKQQAARHDAAVLALLAEAQAERARARQVEQKFEIVVQLMMLLQQRLGRPSSSGGASELQDARIIVPNYAQEQS